MGSAPEYPGITPGNPRGGKPLPRGHASPGPRCPRATLPQGHAAPAPLAVVRGTRHSVQGDAEGKHSVGVLFESGPGVPKSIPDATKWYRLAANQNPQSAKDDLRRLNANK
jgi:hypothetical protein